jgi:hypothetical protein
MQEPVEQSLDMPSEWHVLSGYSPVSPLIKQPLVAPAARQPRHVVNIVNLRDSFAQVFAGIQRIYPG